MSYYNIYPNTFVSYMICSTCSAETFSWLAESFNCAVCNDNNFALPHASITDTEEEIQTKLAEQYEDEVEICLTKVREGEIARRGEAKRGRKRKRSLSDVGGRRV
jgi:hypothetical protein